MCLDPAAASPLASCEGHSCMADHALGGIVLARNSIVYADMLTLSQQSMHATEHCASVCHRFAHNAIALPGHTSLWSRTSLMPSKWAAY